MPEEENKRYIRKEYTEVNKLDEEVGTNETSKTGDSGKTEW